MFTPKDIINFNKIHHLVKIEGFTLDGAKKAIKSFEFKQETTININESKTNDIKEDVINKLEKIKERLNRLKRL